MSSLPYKPVKNPSTKHASTVGYHSYNSTIYPALSRKENKHYGIKEVNWKAVGEKGLIESILTKQS